MPINELLPKEEGYEYSSDLSLLPVRRKVQIPYAPENWKNELAVPGFARTMLNDLWLAFTGPANALTGQYTQNELEQVGLRGGSALAWGGMGMPKPGNALGAGGWIGKKPSAKSAQELKEIENFAKDPLAHFNQAYADANADLKAMGMQLGIHPETGEFQVLFAAGDDATPYLIKGGYAEEYLKKVNDAKEKYSAAVSKEDEFAQVPWEPEADPWVKKDTFGGALTEAYLEAEQAQQLLPNTKTWITQEGNDWVIQHYDTGKKLAFPADSKMNLAMEKLNAAQKAYDAAPSGGMKKPAAPSKSIPLGLEEKQLFLGLPGGTTIEKVAHGTFHMKTPEGSFKMETKGGNVNVTGPGLATKPFTFSSADEAVEFIHDWNEHGPPPGAKGKYGDNDFDDDWEAYPETSLKKGEPYSGYTHAPEYLQPLSKEKMREYTPEELDWEYSREYEKYAKDLFPHAFKDRADFQQKYDQAPLRHLTDKELRHLEYATISNLLSPNIESEQIKKVMEVAGHRRDVPTILEGIRSGQTAPPIVLRHDDGMRILSGNTRLMSALALGKNMPVKVIDIRSMPRKHTEPFDASPPLAAEERAANFNRWFEGSKVVDHEGEPLMMYHATHHKIEQFDPQAIKQHSGGSRDFVSLTDSREFATRWAGGDDAYVADTNKAIYPVYVSAKNPGDFRNPEHARAAAEWVTKNELKNLGWSPQQIADAAKSPTLISNSAQRKYQETFDDQLRRAKLGTWTFWEEPAMWKHFGWDGVFMVENPGDGALNFAAPKPSQIKSVFNKGWWSGEDPRILYSKGAPLPLDLEPVDHDPFTLEAVSGNPFEEKSDDKSK